MAPPYEIPPSLEGRPSVGIAKRAPPPQSSEAVGAALPAPSSVTAASPIASPILATPEGYSDLNLRVKKRRLVKEGVPLTLGPDHECERATRQNSTLVSMHA